MVRLVTAISISVWLTACVAAKVVPDPVETSGLTVSTENPVAPPVPLTARDLTPGVCEELLDNLRQAQPLLENLDQRLNRQARRLEDAVASLPPPPPAPAPDCPEISPQTLDKEIIGALEWLYMEPPGRHYRARVDSGAETSSLSASALEEFERDGDDWVRFVFQHDGPDEAVEIELPIVRKVLIRQASIDEPERRVVVEMDIRLGDQLQTTEFTLSDRSRMTYPVLLGRAFLMDLYVVDVSLSYTHDQYQPPGETSP